MAFALSELQVTSSAFEHGQTIPKRHTGEGEDVSPPLAWRNLPGGTQSLAVFCHDPDAPLVTPGGDYGFVHWILYNIPSTVTHLPEGAEGYTAGPTDFGKTGYGGPMPPEGHGVHFYYFWVLALNTDGQFPEGLTLWQFLEQAEPNIIGMNRLIGAYQRG